MTALRHAIVDDLCHHQQASTVWFTDNLDRLSDTPPPRFDELTPEEVEQVIEREKAKIAPALSTLSCVGRHPDYQAGYYDDSIPPPHPDVRVASPSLVDELCDQLEENLWWPMTEAYELRRWPRPLDIWDLHDASKQRLADRFRDSLARTRHLLRRCGWTDSSSPPTTQNVY